jgi:hypothetical protein
MLHAFSEQKGKEISTIYLIAGKSKKSGNQEFRLVKGELLEGSIDYQSTFTEAKQEYDPITSLHIYSVQPSTPKDINASWAQNETEQLLDFHKKNKMADFVSNRFFPFLFILLDSELSPMILILHVLVHLDQLFQLLPK